MELSIFDAGRAVLGESPLWSSREQALYWVDSIAGVVHRRAWNGDERRTWSFDEEIGSIGLRRGGLVAACRSGFIALDTGTGARTPIASPEPDLPRNRLNDGKVDPAGRFWAGSLQEGQYAPVGNLWRLEGGRAEAYASGLTIPNGLCWSPDGSRMYFTDSPTGRLDVFDYDVREGVPSHRRPFAHVPDGRGLIDGATVDEEGNVWCANIDGGRVLCFDPAGRLRQAIELPVTRPTSCAFGGPGLDVLFITTATRRLTEEQLAAQPWAGHVLQVRLPVHGRVEPEYGASTHTPNDHPRRQA